MRVVLALFVFAVPGLAYAWSGDGHRLIGEVAWRLVTPETRAALAELLCEPDGACAARGDATPAPRQYDSLAEAAVWADAVGRRDAAWRWLLPLHYVDATPTAGSCPASRVPGAPSAPRLVLDDATCPPARGDRGPRAACVVSAIGHFAARLGDRRLSRGERILALRLVAHFVGDLHQPLHVFHRDGKGGNTIDVDVGGHTERLHPYWDDGLVAAWLAGARWPDGVERLLARARSPAIRGPATEALATEIARGWADDVLRDACNPALFGASDFGTLPDGYTRDAVPVVERLLATAGGRLAALLDASLAPLPGAAR